MINLRVRFQPFEVFRLSLNGAFSEFAYLNQYFAIPNSEIRFRVNLPFLHRRPRRRLDAPTHIQSYQTIEVYSDSHY
jgi:hypothetical protein